ncbi:MAG: AAA family ATPase [Aestuariivita sp.]|nr:AAA family ATPase [Aestuariivita sp.]
MPIIVDAVRISGFRGIQDLKMSLARVAVLIGPNNCGKTSVLKAMQLALGDYGRHLSDEDFHIDGDSKRSTEIVVDVRIVAINSEGQPEEIFSREWTNELGDHIQTDLKGRQFFAFRTIAKPQETRTGFLIERHTLREWVKDEEWLSVEITPSQKFSARSEFIPFVSIDAQRDIHSELNQRSSFVGKVLSRVKYDAADVEVLEKMIADINREAVSKSSALESLKDHLKAMNESFGGKGYAEVTPFPKKLRDLSKNFSVYFGDTAASSFSMEYHGMGTRSWASMLAVKAFADLMQSVHAKEAEPYHPIIAAEEPEAHLHPNAQRALFSQLSNSSGQVIVSTHSPYLAAMCSLPDLRSLSVREGYTQCYRLSKKLSDAELKSLQREIMRNKGEVLFAKALILFEGQTEEQVVPVLFEQWFQATAFSKGVTLSAANGRNYGPFLKLGLSLGIPVVIVSDNDTSGGISTRVLVDKQISKVKSEHELDFPEEQFFLDYLSEPNDFEAEIIKSCGLRDEVIAAFVEKARTINPDPSYTEKKRKELEASSDDRLIESMRGEKATNSSFLADKIAQNAQRKSREALVPQAFQNAFSKVEEWLT